MKRDTLHVSREAVQQVARELGRLGVKELRAIEQMLRGRKRALSAEWRQEIARQGGQARARATTKTQRVKIAQIAGRARWTGVSPERRRQIAKKAVAARWAKARQTQPKKRV